MSPELARLSVNRATTKYWPLPELASGCAARGIGGIGLWRDDIAEHGAEAAARLVSDVGLSVTSLCRGGFFTAREPTERRRRAADNRRAVDEAATVGTDVLVLVCGGLPEHDTDLAGARGRVGDAIADLAPYAADRGVRLAIEPLHPMFCSNRCVVSTLNQALDIAAPFPTDCVGVVVDAYHVWWDPRLAQSLARAGERIAAFQVCDWVTPLPAGVLTGRGMLGDGCIALRAMRVAVDAAGYAGPIEVEIFNEALWAREGNEVLDLVIQRHLSHVEGVDQ